MNPTIVAIAEVIGSTAKQDHVEPGGTAAFDGAVARP
jgi:hypothetical protein